jgi:hypothetical protein
MLTPTIFLSSTHRSFHVLISMLCGVTAIVAVVPPCVKAAIESVITLVTPVVSTAQSTPRPFVIFLIASTASSLDESTISVAPIS